MEPDRHFLEVKLLGRIVRLQLQRGHLKRVAGGQKVYDPAPLWSVPELTLAPAGACARQADGSFVLDVHHAAHPETRNHGPNPLSLLFTPHYEAMGSRFGAHLVAGCAGESVLVRSEAMVPLAEIAGGVVIRARGGEVRLVEVMVAAPCKSFSAFALGAPGAAPEALKPALQFLGEGMRGFYCRMAEGPAATIAVGDEVFAV